MKIKSVISAVLVCCLIFTFAFSMTACGEKQSKTFSETEKAIEAPKELTLPVSSDDAPEMNYEELQGLFREAGFKNTSTEGLEDLDSSSDKLNDVIKSVTADGNEAFKKGDKIMSDAKIVIKYHSVKTASLPIDKYDLEEDDEEINYEDAVTQFEKEGFTDISTRTVEDDSKTEGSVKDITVDGKSCKSDLMFSAPVDAKIVIVYYTKTAKTNDKEPEKTESKAENEGSGSKPSADSGTVTPSFKEMMDSYEAFFDEYIAFMKKYEENPSDLSMISEYADYLTKYSDYISKLNEIDEDKLTPADLAYYTEVNARIMKKLSEIGA